MLQVLLENEEHIIGVRVQLREMQVRNYMQLRHHLQVLPQVQGI
jgi:hypothetical protein